MLLIDIPMDLNSKFEVSVWGALCVIETTAIIVAGAAWSIAMLTKQNELQGLQRQRIGNRRTPWLSRLWRD